VNVPVAFLGSGRGNLVRTLHISQSILFQRSWWFHIPLAWSRFFWNDAEACCDPRVWPETFLFWCFVDLAREFQFVTVARLLQCCH